MEAKVNKTINGFCVEVDKKSATRVADIINEQSFVEVLEVKLPMQIKEGKIICYPLCKDAEAQLKKFLSEITL